MILMVSCHASARARKAVVIINHDWPALIYVVNRSVRLCGGIHWPGVSAVAVLQRLFRTRRLHDHASGQPGVCSRHGAWLLPGR